MNTNRSAEEILSEFNEKVEAEQNGLVEELKSVGNEKWEPEGGDWYVVGSGRTINYTSASGTRNFGTERKTKEAAEKAAEQMRRHNRLLAYAAEHNGDWEPDWLSGSQKKWYVSYNHDTGAWICNYRYSVEGVEVYMEEYVAKELAEKLNKEEVVL